VTASARWFEDVVFRIRPVGGWRAIRFDDRSYRVPDLSVMRREAWDRPLALPSDVLITYLLNGAVYRESGRFADEVSVTVPVALGFSLVELVG
jgi:hypothetical protein